MAIKQRDLVPYWFTRQTVTAAADVPIVSYCNGIVAVNIGTIIAYINGFPINPPLVPGTNGESWVIGGNFLEVVGEEQLEITFGAGGVPRVFLSMKYYTDICNH